MFWKAFIVALWVWAIGSPFFQEFGFATLSRPLVNGFAIGLLLGDPVKGTIIGAMVNAVYIGAMSIGGATPADTQLAGTLAASLGILANMEPEVALAFAVPVAVAGGSLNTLKMTLFSLFPGFADRFAEEGNMRGIVFMNIVPGALYSIIKPALITFLAIYYGAGPIERLIAAMPSQLLTALGVAGKLLPAAGFAILLRYLADSVSALPAFFIGFVLATYLRLDIVGIVILAISVAFLVARRGKEAEV